MILCILCGNPDCTEHALHANPERSEDEKLSALWHEFRELVNTGRLPENATLVLYADGSGHFASHKREAPNVTLDAEHGVIYNLEGSLDGTEHVREVQSIRTYHRKTTPAAILCGEIAAWQQAKLCPKPPARVILWNQGRNLTVWLEDRPFVFLGEQGHNIDSARAALRAWLGVES